MSRILMVAYTQYLTDARPRRAAETCAARGDEVEFIGLREGSRPATEEVNNVRLLRLRQARFRGSSSLKYIYSYIRFFLAATVAVVRRFKRRQYDVVYVHTMPDWMVFVGIVPKLLGAKIVLDMHDMMPELYMSKFGVSGSHWLIRLIKLQERLSFKFADRVICVHAPHREVLIRRGLNAEKLRTVLNVPDPSVFGNGAAGTPPSGPTSLRLVYHGTIAKRLGLDIAVEAFRRVASKYPEAQFDIFGDGDYAGALEEIIRAKRLARQVRFVRKFFRVDEVPSLIRDATIGVIANRRDEATEYMLPVKMLEYVYLEIPVVAPDLRAIRYYFPDDAVAYFAPGDPIALGDRLLELCGRESRRIALAGKAREIVEAYSWHEVKKELFEAIDN